MKKALALFLSLVIIFVFAGCSSEYNVFKDIDEKSKQFSHLNIDFDSIEVSATQNLVEVSAEAENVTITVTYDKQEYEKNSENLKVLYVIVDSKKDIFSDVDKKEFFDVCRSMLLIDEWKLTVNDLKDLNEENESYIKTPNGEELSVFIGYGSPSIIDIHTKDIWNYY